MRVALLCCVPALAFFGIPCAAQVQEAQTQPDSYQALSDKFFALLQQDRAADAVGYLFGTNPRLKRMAHEAEQLTAELASVRNVAGPYVTNAMLVESSVAGMYVYQHYFVAFERQPISVRVSYYKRGTVWVCQNLRIDTKVDEAIQRAADANIRIDLK